MADSFLEVEKDFRKIRQQQEEERQLYQQERERILRILSGETARYHTEKQYMDAKVQKASACADYNDVLIIKQIDDLTLRLLEQEQDTIYEGKLKRLAEEYKQLEGRIAEQQKELLNSTEELIISAVASVAKILRDEKKTVECILIYEQLTKIYQNNHNHHYFLATAYEQVNRFREAKEQYLLAGKGSSASAGLARINQKLGVTD